MMKIRFAFLSNALAVLGAAFCGLSPAAQAQSVSGSVYYGPPPGPVYVEPQPVYVYPPAYVYPAPAYVYPPAPAYYYAPPPVYYPQPSYWTPGISATFNFGGDKGGGRHWKHH